mmetsp:Transcript_61727/g.198945  ORF Transcript_61727/g.198945 Transcript_61727/m.198945 type:complete len:270 (-) Transcript_61727:1045-1854(-)
MAVGVGNRQLRVVQEGQTHAQQPRASEGIELQLAVGWRCGPPRRSVPVHPAGGQTEQGEGAQGPFRVAACNCQSVKGAEAERVRLACRHVEADVVPQGVHQLWLVHGPLVAVPQLAPHALAPRPDTAVLVNGEHVVATAGQRPERCACFEPPRREDCLHGRALHVGVHVDEPVIGALLPLATLAVGVVAPGVEMPLVRQDGSREVAARGLPRADAPAEEAHDHRGPRHVREAAARLGVERPLMNLPVLRAPVAKLAHVCGAPSEDLALL